MKKEIQIPNETKVDVPFILRRIVSYPGAYSGTTTGTWDDMDGADNT